MVLPLGPTKVPVAANAVDLPEPPGLMDRPILDTVSDAVARLAEPARATVAWGKGLAAQAMARYGGTKPAVAALVAALVAWFLLRTLGSLVQLAAVALAAYAAFGVLA